MNTKALIHRLSFPLTRRAILAAAMAINPECQHRRLAPDPSLVKHVIIRALNAVGRQWITRMMELIPVKDLN